MKKYAICFMILTVMCVLSFILTYGYEEGTMRNNNVGELFTIIFYCFRFPFTNLLPTQFFILSLLLNVFFYTIVLVKILRVIIKSKTYN